MTFKSRPFYRAVKRRKMQFRDGDGDGDAKPRAIASRPLSPPPPPPPLARRGLKGLTLGFHESPVSLSNPIPRAHLASVMSPDW